MSSWWWPVMICVAAAAVLMLLIIVVERHNARRIRRWRVDYHRRGGLAGDLFRRRRHQPRLTDRSGEAD